MNIIYYKTNHPEVLAAQSAFDSQREALHALCDAFGERFGGKPCYFNSAHGVRFAGLRFAPKKPPGMWTKPCTNGMQNPRAKPHKTATAEERRALPDLRSAWRDGYPSRKDDANRDAVLAAIGTDWGISLFSSLAVFPWDGHLWVSCSATLNDRMQEVLASEWKAAEQALAASRTAVPA